MPKGTRPPTQGEQEQTRAVAIIQDKQREVVRMLESPAKSQLIMELLGDPEIYRRFKAVALHTIARNPNLLLKCTAESIMDALRQAAEVKLEVAGILGEGYLIEYNDIATFQAGYRGLMKLARRSGLVDAVDCHVVFEKDRFEVHLGTNPQIIHDPEPFGDRGKYVGVYAWARLRTGELIIEPMSMADVEKVRRASKNASGQNSPWVNWWEEMARKTVLKRLMKRLPLGEDAESLLRYEAHVDAELAVEHDTPADRTKQLRESALAALPGGATPEAAGESPEAAAPTGPPEQPAGQDGTPEAAGETPDDRYCHADKPDGEEWCIQPPGHAFGDGKPSPHVGPSGDTWPK